MTRARTECSYRILRGASERAFQACALPFANGMGPPRWARRRSPRAFVAALVAASQVRLDDCDAVAGIDMFAITGPLRSLLEDGTLAARVAPLHAQ